MRILMTLAALTATMTLAACSTTGSNNSSVAPGAVGAKECCQGEKLGSEGCCNATECQEAAAAMSAVSEEKSGCCATKCEEAADASMGAVGATSECGTKSDCASQCDGAADASMGAVGATSECGAKSDCASKCEGAEAPSMGAVSEDTCPVTGCSGAKKESCGG